MKDSFIYAYIFPLLFNLTFFTACDGQDKSREKVQLSKEPPTFTISPPDPQIAEYIRHIFQDNNGHLWFGTNGYGIAYYDGDSVSYFSNAQGFDGQQITGITEDAEKNLWFATDQGVVKYNWSGNHVSRKRFTNYSDQQYFEGQRFWSIFADSKGSIWAGSVSGIFRFDGVNWAPFELPYPEEVTGEFITDGTCMSMIEDKVGNMWFATMGFGAFKYDGSTFTQYTEKDGLTNNSVDHIMEDSNGNIWFGTRHGGLSRYDGMTFTNYTSNDSIGNNEVCVIYEDKVGNIWFSSEGYGVYRYNGESFTNYGQKQGLGVRAVQTIYEDREGRFWVGGGGGLYRYDGKSFFNVTKNGPFEKDPNQHLKLNTGLKIEYGPNLGMIDTFAAGNYIHITATITNDSTIPIHLQVALSKEFDFPDSCRDNKYKVFLLPKELTPDTATLYGKITDGLADFLDRCLDDPYSLNKTLEPGEYAVITNGTLFPRLTNCATLPRAVFIQSDDQNFETCDSRMPVRPAGGNQDGSTNPELALGIKLDFYSGKGSTPETCMLIPCGQVSYPEH